MNQPPPTRPTSRQHPPAPRRRSAPPSPRPQVPWVSLTIWGLVIGVIAGVYIQISRWLGPMFETPPPPPFLAESPIGTSPTSDGDAGSNSDPDSGESQSEPSQDESASNQDDSTDLETSAEADPIATEPSSSDSLAIDSPPEPESVADSSRGRVIEPIGLAMRADPSIEAAYLGGLAFNETVTILESNGDGSWQRVRRDFNGLEGWIKAGNIVEIE